LRKRKILCCLLSCLFLLLTRCSFAGKPGDRTRGSTNNTDAIANFQNLRISKPESNSTEKKSDSLALDIRGNQIPDLEKYLEDKCGLNPIIQGKLAVQGKWRVDLSGTEIDGEPLETYLKETFPDEYEKALQLRVPVSHKIQFCASKEALGHVSGAISYPLRDGEGAFPLDGKISDDGKQIEIISKFTGIKTEDLPQELQKFKFGEGNAFPADSYVQEEIILSLTTNNGTATGTIEVEFTLPDKEAGINKLYEIGGETKGNVSGRVFQFQLPEDFANIARTEVKTNLKIETNPGAENIEPESVEEQKPAPDFVPQNTDFSHPRDIKNQVSKPVLIPTSDRNMPEPETNKSDPDLNIPKQLPNSMLEAQKPQMPELDNSLEYPEEMYGELDELNDLPDIRAEPKYFRFDNNFLSKKDVQNGCSSQASYWSVLSRSTLGLTEEYGRGEDTRLRRSIHAIIGMEVDKDKTRNAISNGIAKFNLRNGVDRLATVGSQKTFLIIICYTNPDNWVAYLNKFQYVRSNIDVKKISTIALLDTPKNLGNNPLAYNGFPDRGYLPASFNHSRVVLTQDEELAHRLSFFHYIPGMEVIQAMGIKFKAERFAAGFENIRNNVFHVGLIAKGDNSGAPGATTFKTFPEGAVYLENFPIVLQDDNETTLWADFSVASQLVGVFGEIHLISRTVETIKTSRVNWSFMHANPPVLAQY